jgi:hypothetical protein
VCWRALLKKLQKYAVWSWWLLGGGALVERLRDSSRAQLEHSNAGPPDFEKSERGAFSTCASFTLTRVLPDAMRTVVLGAVTVRVAGESAKSATRSFSVVSNLTTSHERPIITRHRRTNIHTFGDPTYPTDRITECESRLWIPDPSPLVPSNLSGHRDGPRSHNISEPERSMRKTRTPGSITSCHPLHSLHTSLRHGLDCE